jgi:hypothetical protein
MSGLREALVNGLTHYNFCYAEIHASEPSIAMPEEVELVADAVLRVLAGHDTQQVREQVVDALFYASDERITFESDPSLLELMISVMAVVAPIVAARDAVEADLAAARQQLDQVRALHTDLLSAAERNLRGNDAAGDAYQNAADALLAILDAPVRPAGHDESGQ